MLPPSHMATKQRTWDLAAPKHLPQTVLFSPFISRVQQARPLVAEIWPRIHSS